MRLLRLSALAILNNVAAPLCSALKLSMLCKAGTASVAAYAGVSAVVDCSARQDIPSMRAPAFHSADASYTPALHRPPWPQPGPP